MSGFVDRLRGFERRRDFFVGLDSDGCVFDSMEVKHKECFVPMFVRYFGLAAVSRYARECWEFVNLYSRMRGINRFPALSNSLNLLRDRVEVRGRGVEVWGTDLLDGWIGGGGGLGNGALEAEVVGGCEGLRRVLDWSLGVNGAIEDIVRGVPPFPLVRETLARLARLADVVVVSQTPVGALEREWGEHALSGYVRLIAGQEMGSKREHLGLAAVGRYELGRILMVGDAPGDFKAAKSHGVLFYPILPGGEERSWGRLFEEALPMFFDGCYGGEYEASLVAEFDACLPSEPGWLS